MLKGQGWGRAAKKAEGSKAQSLSLLFKFAAFLSPSEFHSLESVQASIILPSSLPQFSTTFFADIASKCFLCSSLPFHLWYLCPKSLYDSFIMPPSSSAASVIRAKTEDKLYHILCHIL